MRRPTDRAAVHAAAIARSRRCSDRADSRPRDQPRRLVAANRRTCGSAVDFHRCCLLGPFLVGRFIYQATYNELKAGYDVATGTLDQLKPRLNDLELASRLVAKRVEPSVVSIIRPSRPRQLDGQGSGVIVDKAGYIVTNYHVVDGADTVQVRLSDRRVAEARSSAPMR